VASRRGGDSAGFGSAEEMPAGGGGGGVETGLIL